MNVDLLVVANNCLRDLAIKNGQTVFVPLIWVGDKLKAVTTDDKMIQPILFEFPDVERAIVNLSQALEDGTTSEQMAGTSILVEQSDGTLVGFPTEQVTKRSTSEWHEEVVRRLSQIEADIHRLDHH